MYIYLSPLSLKLKLMKNLTKAISNSLAFICFRSFLKLVTQYLKKEYFWLLNTIKLLADCCISDNINDLIKTLYCNMSF